VVVKINVSIPQDVLEKLDAAARDSKKSRSGLLTEAVKRFLEEKEEEKQMERRRKAAETIDKIREQIGPWDGTAEILKWRDSH
jgi:metal-responsive CopG/Arc/MetJ family transcriptional regulator